MLLDTSTSGSQWIAIAIALLGLIYFSFVRPKRKGKKDPLERKPGDVLLAQQRSMERDMTALLVEYEQMMRTMTAQLETRVAKLEILLHDADERIASLQAAKANAAVPSGVAASGVVPSGADSTVDAVADDVPSFRLRDRTTGFVPDADPPRHADVYELADQGLTYRQIAQRLDRAYGEIELILALRAKAGPDANSSGTTATPESSPDSDDSTHPDLPDDPVATTGHPGDDVERDGGLVLSGAPASSTGFGAGGSNQSHGRRRKKRR
ncbi:hypothetical protein [Humisphaera borealis]|uniref:DUF2802 domain-containing protein n=1 Tax=Humisphaera borealis TaxID=2807512 RepID=A0A7M2X1H1_9BACT|nr:hypothetical protein [Humisphaera borealis]QOV91597.1 hypothetical protein IPV69_09640 [Humisphaera borealis]